jgi:hypothetical protein
MVDSSNANLLLKSTDKGDNWSTVFTGGGEIEAILYDYATGYLWIVENDNTTHPIVHYFDTDDSDSKTDLDTMSTGIAGSYFVQSIFKIGSNIYCLSHEDRAGPILWHVVNKIDVNPMVEQDTINTGGDFSITGFSSGVVETDASAWHFIHTSDDNYCMFFTITGPAFTQLASFPAGYTLSREQANTGASRDGDPTETPDNIYITLTKTATGVEYLYRYNVSGNSYTELGQYDVILQSQLNSASGIRVKAFSLTEDKVYQIPYAYNGRLNLISTFNFSDTINALTDNFLIDESGNMYELVDFMSSIFEGIIYHSRQDYPYLKMRFNSDNVTIVPQQVVSITGSYTVDGSTTTNQVIFEGIAKTPTEGRIQYVLVENQGSEMDQAKPDGLKSGRTDEILTDINNDNAPAGPEYINDGTLAEGSAMGNIHFNKTKTLRKTYNDFAEKDNFLWSLRPQGTFDYNAGGIDSGADLRYDGSGNKDIILQVHAWKVAKLNQIIVNGANNTGTGNPYSGIWNDLEDQQANGINPVTIEDGSLNSDAKCQSKADTMGGNETERTRVRFKFRKTTYGLIQPGQTITFKYDVTNYITIPEAQYILDKLILNIKTEIAYAEISSGL